MNMTEFCPLCLLKGKTTELKYLQMNLQEATKMCMDVQCSYPLVPGYSDVFIRRDVMDLDKELKPPSNKNAVPVVPKEQQREQSTTKTPSSILKTTGSFEELNNWCNTEFIMSNEGTTSNEKFHMDMPNFSNEELMELFDFQDSVNAEEKPDSHIDSEIDRLLEEGLRDLATDTNEMALLDNGLGDFNIETQVNSIMMETGLNSVSSGGHMYDTDGALRDGHKRIKDKSLLDVGEKKLNIPKSQSDNLKEVSELGIKNVVEHCLSLEGIDNVNNRPVVQVVRSENIADSLIPELKEKSQLIVVKCKENIDLPICNDMSKNVVSVTYINKQNGQKITCPNPSYKILKSHQQHDLKKQILFTQSKNAKTSLNSVKKNKKKFEGNSSKREVKQSNELTFDWHSIASNTILAKNGEDKKQIRKGSEIHNAGKESNTQLSKFQGFSFHEALKSISDGKSDLRRGFKTLLKIPVQRSQPNVKTLRNNPIQLGGKSVKGKI